ncbi:MAG TPA: hypothetical protein ENK62_02075 [Chromatiales bacterium]|nr:hypothetical protein [Chromatiales bacterium]
MLEEIPVNDPKVYGFRARGRLTHEDYERWVPRLEEILQAHRPIALLIELEDFEGWDREAFWDDLRFGLVHETDISRIAVVGDRAWQRLMVNLIRPLFTTELRYFDRKDLQKAWDWLHEPVHAERVEPRDYRHVVAAVELAPGARAVVAQAAAVARRYGARLTLLTSVDDLPFYDQLEGPTFPDPMELLEELRTAAQRRLHELAGDLGGVQAETAVETGPPQLAVVDFAGEHGADLLVLGSRVRHGLGRLLGTVTHGVLNDAPCDVLVVRLS